MQIKDVVNGKNQSIAFWIMSALMGVLTVILSIGLQSTFTELKDISKGNEQRATKIAVLEESNKNQTLTLNEIKTEMKELNKTMSEWQREWRNEYMKKKASQTEPDMGAMAK